MEIRFKRLMFHLPSIWSGLKVRTGPREAYARVLRLFERAGFYVAAEDSGLMRFCAYRRGRQYNCTCMHVIWVKSDQELTYVNYGIEPRYRHFLLCNSEDHEEKLDQCGRAVRKAIDEVDILNGPAFEIVSGIRWRRLIAGEASSPSTFNDHFGLNPPSSEGPAIDLRVSLMG